MRRGLACALLLLAFAACNDDDEHPTNSGDASVIPSDAGTPDTGLPATDANTPATDANTQTTDAGTHITSCLDLPGDLPMPPTNALNCDLLPPDLAR